MSTGKARAAESNLSLNNDYSCPYKTVCIIGVIGVTFNSVINKCDMHTVELGCMSLHGAKLLMITCMGSSS